MLSKIYLSGFPSFIFPKLLNSFRATDSLDYLKTMEIFNREMHIQLSQV